MFSFQFRCPTTGMVVTGWQRDTPAAVSGPHLVFVAERCPACGGLHIVNPMTGRLLAQEMPARPVAGAVPPQPRPHPQSQPHWH
ncbi:MAG: hypothetical protein LCH95_04545 [Proteobacteria bacterium]|nr:hypothetical protein [Pseudomonadota bacterium]